MKFSEDVSYTCVLHKAVKQENKPVVFLPFHVTWSLTLNERKLQALAARALRNKGLRAQDGALTVRIESYTPVEQEDSDEIPNNS